MKNKFIKTSAIVFFLILVNSLFVERYLVRMPVYEIESNKIPKSFDGYRIAVLSDLHYGFLVPEFWIANTLNKINEQNPDLIVGIGDYVKKRNFDQELINVWKLLGILKAKDGELFVNGNHDHWANHNLSLKLLEESGKSARNRIVFINKGVDQIAIAGLGDYWEDHIPIDDVLRGSSQKDFRIVLAHNPDSANAPHSGKIDLFIAGHTHGGQVRIPFLNKSPVLPVQDKNFDIGIKKSKYNELVFISAGVGWSIIPVRFYCPVEVPIIVLRSK
ncbi:phosphohydrolase [Leptospira congkakensis]|uniref:Phosphohydrolase n=1 Tax=Leptospira congkakensis TaxID=2484932 RepID=A0A4Z1AJA0_9LEPT|nr:metallophosphoesterase [Leptospira congkakensis]TGL88628.1 phosphohydrolase [Leptospira congkakensis]TGL89214.1 phosphohydrolase [Leptospira congkakensis]TGL97182.1 phosphohydrolase [Leptospira congkakensis]